MIVRGKQALDIQWNLALWGNKVCDLLTCKGIFNFLFLPEEIKFLDVLHFVGKANHRHSSLSSTGLNGINHAVPAWAVLICMCLHISTNPPPQKKQNNNNKTYMHSTSEMDTINWFCCEYSQPLLGAYYVVLQNTLVWVWRIVVIALYFTHYFSMTRHEEVQPAR